MLDSSKLLFTFVSFATAIHVYHLAISEATSATTALQFASEEANKRGKKGRERDRAITRAELMAFAIT